MVAAKCHNISSAKEWVTKSLQSLLELDKTQSINLIKDSDILAIASIKIPPSPYRWLDDVNHAIREASREALHSIK